MLDYMTRSMLAIEERTSGIGARKCLGTSGYFYERVYSPLT